MLLESGQEQDIKGHPMPNLIYVSREKNKASPHNFKAGALNTLVSILEFRFNFYDDTLQVLYLLFL